MKKHYYLIFLVFIFKMVNAQVSNDDCQNAQVLYINYNPNGNCFDGEIADTSFWSSNINSVPNYPYPSNPNPCIGYTSQIAVPSNDVWYVVNNVSDNFGFLIYCSDTTHVSFWLGDSCSALSPYRCYTLAGDTFKFDTFIGDICQPNKLYMQISGNRIGKFITFGFCFWNYPLYCIMYDDYGNTPVLCFNYNINHTDASSNQANDGSAIININGGNAPYTYHWNDGNTDSTRTNLSVGEYYVTITDKNGCQERDSINIAVATDINSNIPPGNNNFYITPIPSCDFIKASYNSDIRKTHFEIIDLSGHIIKSGIITNNRQIIDIRSLTSGVYFIKIINEKTVGVRKIIKI